VQVSRTFYRQAAARWCLGAGAPRFSSSLLNLCSNSSSLGEKGNCYPGYNLLWHRGVLGSLELTVEEQLDFGMNLGVLQGLFCLLDKSTDMADIPFLSMWCANSGDCGRGG
jgi:hypothetical protein